MLHDVMHEVLVPPPDLTVAHEREDFSALSHTIGRGECITIAVFALPECEEVTGDLVGLDPDVDRPHYFPGVDRAVFFAVERLSLAFFHGVIDLNHILKLSKVPC